jgi:hypothetical protein
MNNLQDSAGPRQIVCDLPMTQRGPAEKAGRGLRNRSKLYPAKRTIQQHKIYSLIFITARSAF